MKTKLVFVSGAAGGIGQAVAKYFAAEGYELWLTDVNQDGVLALGDELGAIKVSVVDLSRSDALEKLCKEIEGFDGSLDLAFVNAGVIKPGEVIALTRNDIDFQLDINLKAAAHLNHAIAIKMVSQQCGHIINTLSAAAMIALPENAAYSASKFGLRGFVLSLAQELSAAGVAVSGIYPNAIDTPMLRYEAKNNGSALNFLSEPSSTEEIVGVVKKAVKQRKLEYFVPASDSWVNKLVTSFPGLLPRFYNYLLAKGERGREKFIRDKGL